MAIQINEFEIVADETPAPQARGGGDTDEAASPAAHRVGPEEVVSAVRVCRERVERVRAD